MFSATFVPAYDTFDVGMILIRFAAAVLQPRMVRWNVMCRVPASAWDWKWQISEGTHLGIGIRS